MAEQRLIDANALDTRERGNNSQCTMWWNIRKIINEAPTVDAKPVVHAHWVSKDTMEKSPYAKNHYCSNCKVDVIECGNFCTNCGAQMDEKENDDG